MAHSENFVATSNRVTLTTRVGLVLVRAYQLVLGPFMGGACRFEPSCSEYAIQAITEHGLLRGSRLAARRIARCHPLASAGYDPVPPRSSGQGGV
ncbi:MAG TPA: membrane protein insertion efficiency factor YidD [Vicinamibacterales bacterium]|nr:membrane protein insertion efficiency factor YidD [Vicinamibacterales bacterium]